MTEAANDQPAVAPETVVTVTVTVETLNVILTALETKPYNVVGNIIPDIRGQAMAQLSQTKGKKE